MRRMWTFLVAGVIAATGAACGPPTGTPAPGPLSVEGPVYTLDTVVVRGSGCDPNYLTAVKLALWPAQGQPYVELRPMGSPGANVGPDGSVAVTVPIPLMPAGTYPASLVCSSTPPSAPTTHVVVEGGYPPAATFAMTSPVPSGRTGMLTARHCGRSANGEIDATASAVGAGGNFSFYGYTKPDGSVAQSFTVPANAGAGVYTVTLTCGRHFVSHTATGVIQVV
jgi:hypothetical protein